MPPTTGSSAGGARRDRIADARAARATQPTDGDGAGAVTSTAALTLDTSGSRPGSGAGNTAASGVSGPAAKALLVQSALRTLDKSGTGRLQRHQMRGILQSQAKGGTALSEAEV